MTKPPVIPYLILSLTLILFILSCTFPALEFMTEGQMRTSIGGGLALLTGWFGVLSGQFAWLANVALLFALMFFWKQRFGATIISSLLALGLAAHTLALFDQQIPEHEGATTLMRLHSLEIGFYLWAGSMALLLFGALVSHSVGRVKL